MVIINAPATLLIATAVWLIWRIVTWRRRGGDVVREFVVTALFLVTLLIVQITQFPMKIIFYDWASVINLVPFASITQLIQHTNTQVAFTNIVGNVVLFMPLGFLLPILFRSLQRPWPMIWRGAAISVAIELMQLITRARAVDIDDVILNTLGAALGFAIYRVVATLIRRFGLGRRLLDRAVADTEREQLLIPLWPIGVTLLIAIPMVLS
ncbi:MAG: VanZ family protein, partial [Acidimicrobiia bacterium]|nr:VanZ family protein [Acidimicrobiia bacterium]